MVEYSLALGKVYKRTNAILITEDTKSADAGRKIRDAVPRIWPELDACRSFDG